MLESLEKPCGFETENSVVSKPRILSTNNTSWYYLIQYSIFKLSASSAACSVWGSSSNNGPLLPGSVFLFPTLCPSRKGILAVLQADQWLHLPLLQGELTLEICWSRRTRGWEVAGLEGASAHQQPPCHESFMLPLPLSLWLDGYRCLLTYDRSPDALSLRSMLQLLLQHTCRFAGETSGSGLTISLTLESWGKMFLSQVCFL